MNLRIASYNCRSFKKSLEVVTQLCNQSDVCLLQETWLTPDELALLGGVHSDFSFTGVSAVDTSVGIIRGRPYGGLGILWRKNLESYVKPVKFSIPRLAGITVNVHNRVTLICTVYMPVAIEDNVPEFVDVLGYFAAITEELNPTEVICMGDFNAHPSRGFYTELTQFCSDLRFTIYDTSVLPADSFTFISDAHNTTSWTDHCIISESLVERMADARIIYDSTPSDHLPLLVAFKIHLLGSTVVNETADFVRIAWSDSNLPYIGKYKTTTDELLAKMSLPLVLQCENLHCSDKTHLDELRSLYVDLIGVPQRAVCSSFGVPRRRRWRHVPGWSAEVADAYRASRLAFLDWIRGGRPTTGEALSEMRRNRAVFKKALRRAKGREDQLRADAVASRFAKKDFAAFWRATSALCPTSVPRASVVDGVSGETGIANMWRDVFSELGSLYNDNAELAAVDIDCSDCAHCAITSDEVKTAISKLKLGKAAGWDQLCPEHIKYAGHELTRLLSHCFTAMVFHGFVPDELTRTIVTPVVKNKTGDLSSASNYRPIALSTALSKVFECIVLGRCERFLDTESNQFGFKKLTGATEAVHVLKETVRYYNHKDTPVYACFLDLDKAFDRVHHRTLICDLMNRGLPRPFIRLLQNWNISIHAQVRWGSSLSTDFYVRNGVRQGSLLSPSLFNVYIDELHNALRETKMGCYLGGTLINSISYADDMVLLSPSLSGLKKLLGVCEEFAAGKFLLYNVQKTKMLVFRPRRYKCLRVPTLRLCGEEIDVVSEFKYLGHYITADLDDSNDIQRHYKLLCVRANMISRRFARCSPVVKNLLFQTYCGNLYMGELWVNHTLSSWRRLQVCYNNAFRRLRGFPRLTSASGMFATARIPTLPALRRRKIAGFRSRLSVSDSDLVRAISQSDVLWCSPLYRSWSDILHGIR